MIVATTEAGETYVEGVQNLAKIHEWIVFAMRVMFRTHTGRDFGVGELRAVCRLNSLVETNSPNGERRFWKYGLLKINGSQELSCFYHTMDESEPQIRRFDSSFH